EPQQAGTLVVVCSSLSRDQASQAEQESSGGTGDGVCRHGRPSSSCALVQERAGDSLENATTGCGNGNLLAVKRIEKCEHCSFGYPAAALGGTHFSRMVTSSSAALGCKAMVESKSALVAPTCSAIAATCTISAASGPSTWTPSTFWVGRSTTSFMSIRSSRP